MRAITRPNRRGSILLLTLLLLGALLFFGVSLLNHYVADRTLQTRQEAHALAEEAAKAGIDRALYELAHKADWHPDSLKVTLPHSHARFELSFAPTSQPHSLNNVQSTTPAVAYDGRTVPPGMVHLVSIGRCEQAFHQEEALAEVRPGLFSGAIFGARLIELKGGTSTDSFNSEDGSYGSQSPGRDGNVGTNSIAGGAIYLANADIRGEIQIGPGGTEGMVIDTVGHAHYDSCSVRTAPRPLPIQAPPTGTNQGAADTSSGSLNPGIYTTLSVRSNHNLNLAPGTYVFTEDIELGSGATLNISGNVNLYLLADVHIQGNAQITGTTVPPNLMIYGGANSQDWDFRGLSNTELACGLYAPYANLDMRGISNFYGGLIVDTLHTNGQSNFHYDTALGGGGPGNVILHSRW